MSFYYLAMRGYIIINSLLVLTEEAQQPFHIDFVLTKLDESYI